MSIKPKIMFIDDERNAIESYRRMLRRFTSTWDISYETDSRAARDEINQNLVDVVVTDVGMPFVSGLELLADLKADTKTQDISVIVVTGEHDRDLKRRALDAGAADLMNKPVEFEELLARLRCSLRLKASQDELNQRNDCLEQRVAERTRELRESRLEIVAKLANAAEFRDQDTGKHVVRVAHYSRLIAQALNLPPDDVEAIFVAAPLHDVGKIAIPDSILLKPGKLTEEERNIMRTHCAIGGQILGNTFEKSMNSYLTQGKAWSAGFNTLNDPILNTALEIAVTHHEHWDGKGYPAGLAGEEIPLAGRIVALADVFDALTTSRPYKTAYSLERTLKLISDGVGRQFDPRVFGAFLSALPEIEELRSALSDDSSTERPVMFSPRMQATA